MDEQTNAQEADPGPAAGPVTDLPVVKVPWDTFEAIQLAAQMLTVPTMSMPIAGQGWPNIIVWVDKNSHFVLVPERTAEDAA